MKRMQLAEVDIAPVHHVESTGLRDEVIEDIRLVPLAIADMQKAGDIAAHIQQSMQPDYRLA